jgi:mRNA interferase RelE/StbE
LAWKIEFVRDAKKELVRIDRKAQRDILHFLKERVATAEDPRQFGAPLRKNLSGLWRYRVCNYRIIADIQDDRFTVLVVRVGHRRRVYGGH